MKANNSLRLIYIVILCVVLFAGRHRRQRLYLVCVVDLSSSIEVDARAEAFAALRAIFTDRRLQRGDTVVVVPITNDTATEAQGQVLRFEIGEQRAAYDADLRRLAVEVEHALGEMQSESAARPSTQSDVLGAISLAEEEIRRGNGSERKILIILGDLLHDTASCKFTTSPQLATDEAARRYAASLAEGQTRTLEGTQVYLGLLRSTELRRVSQARRTAIQSFWTEYLQRAGASSVSIATDGPGQLAQAVKPLR